MSHEYEDDLQIDPEALDVEWLHQPLLYQKYCEMAAEADKRAKEAKERVKVIEAELVLKAHQGAIDEELNIGKLTEAKVSAWVRTQPTYQEAVQEEIEAAHEAEILRGAVFAFAQRKNALENLVVLHGQSYFASPRVPRDIGEEWQKRVEESVRDRRFAKQAAKVARKRKRRSE